MKATTRKLKATGAIDDRCELLFRLADYLYGRTAKSSSLNPDRMLAHARDAGVTHGTVFYLLGLLGYRWDGTTVQPLVAVECSTAAFDAHDFALYARDFEEMCQRHWGPTR